MANDDFQNAQKRRRRNGCATPRKKAKSRGPETQYPWSAGCLRGCTRLFGPSVSESLTDVMRESFAAFEGLRRASWNSWMY